MFKKYLIISTATDLVRIAPDTDNRISDSKSISKAIGLKTSRTRDYLKQLVDEGVLEIVGEYKNRKYKIKK